MFYPWLGDARRERFHFEPAWEELQVTSYKLQVTSYKLQVTSFHFEPAWEEPDGMLPLVNRSL